MSAMPPSGHEWDPPPGQEWDPPAPPPSDMAPTAMSGWATLGTGERVELASPGRRFGARVIDFVIILVILLALMFVGVGVAFGLTSGDSAAADDSGAALIVIFVISAVIALVLTLLYEVTLIAVKGRTLGKMATGIKVVRADSGSVPGWGKSIGRWIIPGALTVIPYAGWILSLLVYVSLLWDKTRQGWHDKAAGTVVIRV